uniref:Uncharacterized protein n=1 Tax=Romanomermis culicivorax TaxID=13658 RepID=A0A915J7C0_ROMCU
MVCDQQQLNGYISCMKSAGDAAVQFMAIKETEADFITALNGCFTKYGCSVPSITMKNVTDMAVCKNAIVQDANVAQAFAKCFQYKNFTLPAITSLTFPPFNIRKYSHIDWIRNIKMNCKSNRMNERQATLCVNGLFLNHSQAQQHIGNMQVKQIFKIKKKRTCSKLVGVCQREYTTMRALACRCSQIAPFPQTFGPTTECPKVAQIHEIRSAARNYYCNFFTAGAAG